MTAMRITVSHHVQTERAERLTFILSNPDLCDFTPAVERRYPDKIECITADGVMLVKSLDGSFLITAYVPSLDKVRAVYRAVGLAMPQTMTRKVKRNEKKYMKIQNWA